MTTKRDIIELTIIYLLVIVGVFWVPHYINSWISAHKVLFKQQMSILRLLWSPCWSYLILGITQPQTYYKQLVGRLPINVLTTMRCSK